MGLEWNAPNRVMTLTVTGITLTQQKKTTAQNFLNTKFGIGKVTIGKLINQ